MSALVDSQPADARSLDQAQRNALIVSAVLVDETWQVLSRYGDPIWEFRGRTTNRSVSRNKIDFNKVPEVFRELLRAIMYRYVRRGRFGSSRPGSSQIERLFTVSIRFFRYLQQLKLDQLSAATPMVCAMYLHEYKSMPTRSGGQVRPTAINQHLLVIEALYDLSQFTDDPMPSFPCPDDSAWNLAGRTGKQVGKRLQSGRTPLLPDNVFVALFQAAWSEVRQAPQILDHRDELHRIDVAYSNKKRGIRQDARRRYLESMGWGEGLHEFNKRVTHIRSACYIVVASLSGCRNHELAFVQTDSCYRTVDDDGEEYWWMRSQSTKTDEGLTEWMIPAAAAEALKIMDRWAAPYQREVLAEIERRRQEDAADTEIAEAQRHVGAVFLGRDPKKGPSRAHQIRTFSDRSWNMMLTAFATRHGISWSVATHQFRRTFANYAARSQFGDLRYLKEHFKHWSLDMTLGYAMNEYQEVALYSEVYDELADLKEGIVSDWMESGVPLAGGLGQRVVDWRGSNDVTLFKDHKSMVRTLAEGFGNLRSNGHAWCTADQGIDCVGNGGLDRTRCTGCDHAVIGGVHAKVYQGLYDHLGEALQCNDIGEGGLAYVRRSLDRCADVLRSLGHEPNRGQNT